MLHGEGSGKGQRLALPLLVARPTFVTKTRPPWCWLTAWIWRRSCGSGGVRQCCYEKNQPFACPRVRASDLVDLLGVVSDGVLAALQLRTVVPVDAVDRESGVGRPKAQWDCVV